MTHPHPKYESGINNNILYSNQPTIKIGLKKIENTNSTFETLRGVVSIDINSDINTSLASNSAYIANSEYSVLHSSLTLSSVDGATSGLIYAVMLPLDADVTSSVYWDKPSRNPNANTGSWTSGGSVEPLAKNIVQTGIWSGETVSFDITPFVNIWRGTTKPNFSLLLKSDEKSPKVMEFHSQQAESPIFGAKQQTNVVFLGAGDTNSINTEGILIKIDHFSPYLTIESADSNTTASQRWSAFNASISVGNTFSMFLPDLNISPRTYTLIDKRTGENGVKMVISGNTGGIASTIHTTAEFVCTGTVPAGSGIVQFSAPDTSLITDLSTLNSKDTVIFEYTPTITPNNATSYTVDFYSDERKKNNRVRLYTKETTASENRTGMYTKMKNGSVTPRVSLALSF